MHMLLLGFSCGLPYFLIFSTLSLWLSQAGLSKSSITYFSWAVLGYSFKFMWSPLVDRIPIVFLTRFLGQRKSWMLLSQVVVMASIIAMGMTNPKAGDEQLLQMALVAVLLGFSAATQDICVDAWRIEVSNQSDIAMMSSLYVIGYRVGMIISGAGALFLAAFFGASSEYYDYLAWQKSYLIMSSLTLIGMVTTFFIARPAIKTHESKYKASDYLGILILFFLFVGVFIFAYRFLGSYKAEWENMISQLMNDYSAAFLSNILRFLFSISVAFLVALAFYSSRLLNREMGYEVYVEPIIDFIKAHRKHAVLLISIVALYRLSDLVLGVSANLFYEDMGFSLVEIAWVSKTYGLIMILFGAVLSGFLADRLGVLGIMIVGAIASSLTNLLFMVMAALGGHLYYLVFMITADNLAQGFANTALVAFTSLLINKQFTAVQYAVFSSIMTLFPKILGGFSGSMIDFMGYQFFFLSTAVMGVPVVLLLFMAKKRGVFNKQMNTSYTNK